MRNTVYRYNTLTCQYERVKLSARSVAWYVLGVVVMASCMLVGILLLHDLLVHTPNEKRLRKENRALTQHHALLSAELNTLQPVLTSLQNKDRVLHTQFFGAPPTIAADDLARASKEAFLLADALSFRRQVASLKAASGMLAKQSRQSNTYFGDHLVLDEKARERLNARPTLQPVMPWQSDMLISGFGLRVNPFHKGLYNHPGVDIAMPRGTPVIATGPGRVAQLKRSDLQAGYGNYVEIDHGEGMATRYAHLEEIVVHYGARVKKGDTIATVGTSGGSVAPHVHYEILQDGKNLDPITFMVEGISSEEHHRLTELSHRQNQSLD